MKRSICRKFKKSVSAILAASMSLSLFTGIPVSADIGKTTYNYDGYSVNYNITNEWDGAQTVELTVSNTGTDSILNWALKYDAEGEINNLWNANLYEQNGSEYVIKNTGWNFEIAPNQSVTYGYTLNGSALSLPDSFEIYSKRVEKTEGYDVSYSITKSWDTGVEGNIVISNTSNAAIEAWTLSFDSNFNVDYLWNGRVLENNGTSYTVAAEVWTNPVQPNSTMTIGFVGSKAADVEAALDNFRLTEVVIGEGTPVIPIDPPVEDIEISANAALQESGDIAVSWTSNKQEGTFDILMSDDGVNFASVGTVTGASEYLDTPESDFETLYFKVVQTVGEQSAESNVVSVVNNKPSEDIVISAVGVYDEESGNTTVSWKTNTDNGSFEIFMSEDGESFASISTVEGVSEYVYTPATDFEEIYFKIVQTVGEKSAESNVVTVKSNIVLSVITSAYHDEETGNIKVSWITSLDRGTYEIFVSEDDENFTSLGIIENVKEYIYTPEGEFVVLYFKVKQTVDELTSESKSVAAFYSIDWEDETDTDQDGLTDVCEKYYFGTDLTNPDTDGDGLPDGYEYYYLETDPAMADSDDNGINDGDEDFDNDGLSNLREYELNTTQYNRDSDNDGLIDNEEVNTYNTDPLKYDTDDDGIFDSDEIALGLDPTSAATDGTLDSERTFMQHVGADSEIFSDINTADNPFEVSIDITAAGVAASNLYSHKSYYSNAIKNDAILGITPEFTYTDGLKVEDVIINFTIDKSAEMNYNNKYTDISDEFVGIKRLNVFKFFEDTNMLLPIETFHDVENNRVYTHVDELGTYCLMDMEIWLENLGITAEDLADNTNAATFSARSMPVLYNDDNEISVQSEQKYLDVVLVVYPKFGIEDIVQDELIQTSNMIFENAKIQNMDARIFYVSAFGDSVANTTYVTNINDAKKVIGKIAGISDSVDKNSYLLTKSMRYTYETVTSFFRKGSERYCFVVDAHCTPGCDPQNAYVDYLKGEDVKVHFAYNKRNENVAKYMSLSTDNIAHEIIPDGGRFNFGNFILKRIFGANDKDYLVISATGWNEIHLDEPITANYRQLAESFINNDALRHTAVNSGSYADTDNDGLLDLEELLYSVSGNDLITWDNSGTVALPTFGDCMDFKDTLFYVENGLKRYSEQPGFEGYEQFDSIRILPIKADPNSSDGDGDGVLDIVELLYDNGDERYDNISPLKTDTVESLYPELQAKTFGRNSTLNDIFLDIDGNNITITARVFFIGAANTPLPLSSSNALMKDLFIQGVEEYWSGLKKGSDYDFLPGMDVNLKCKVIECPIADPTGTFRSITVRMLDNCGFARRVTSGYSYFESTLMPAGGEWSTLQHKVIRLTPCHHYSESQNSGSNKGGVYEIIRTVDNAVKLTQNPKNCNIYRNMEADARGTTNLGSIDERFKYECAHEFGHALGIWDAYGSSSSNNGFAISEVIDPSYPSDSKEFYNYDIMKDANKQVTLIHCDSVTTNDVEMFLQAFVENDWQYFYDGYCELSLGEVPLRPVHQTLSKAIRNPKPTYEKHTGSYWYYYYWDESIEAMVYIGDYAYNNNCQWIP